MPIIRGIFIGSSYRHNCLIDLRNRRLLAWFNGSFPLGIYVRQYSISVNIPDDEHNQIHHDKKWPSKKHPTPYEIFGIPQQSCSNTNPSTLDGRMLKKRYHEYAKLYHPDISQNIRIIRSPIEQHAVDSRLLSFDEKLLRFKIITQAYEILSNNQKKNLYDCTKAGWSYGPVNSTITNSTSAYPNRHGYQSDSTYEYYNAGTWEEMNDLNSRDHEKEKLNPWTIFLWVCGLVVCLQATALLTRIENSLTSKQFTHEETEFDLAQSYTNYGLDSDKFSRFRRFLWFRTYGLYRAKEDLDREAKINEGIVKGLMKAVADKENESENINHSNSDKRKKG